MDLRMNNYYHDDVPLDSDVFLTNWGGLSQRFFHLLLSGEMYDIQLQVGSQVYDAHKLILSASSDVFKTMLNNRKWSEAHKQIVELKEDPLCAPHFEQFIFYIYSGQFYVSHSNVCPLLMLADKYNVTDLIPMCRNYMLANLDAPSDRLCVLQWWRYADLRNDPELKMEIQKYININFERVCQSPDFLLANLDTVEHFFSSSKLVVSNEIMIIYSMLQWIQTYSRVNDISYSQAKPVFKRLLEHVRWPMMTNEEMNFLKDVDIFKQILNELCWIFQPSPPYLTSIDESVPCLNELFIENLRMDVNEERDKNASIIPCNCFLSESLESKDLSSRTCFCDCGRSKCMQTERENKSPKTTIACPSLSINQHLSRIYINDLWATELAIYDYSDFPKYASRTFFFSSPKLGHYSENDSESLEWEVELHPKGICFPPAILIGVDGDGNKLIDEVCNDIVRLSVMSRSSMEMPFKVDVNILVRAKSLSRQGKHYFEGSHSRLCLFEEDGQRQIFDNVVPVCDIENKYLLPSDTNNSQNISDKSLVTFSLFIVIRPHPP